MVCVNRTCRVSVAARKYRSSPESRVQTCRTATPKWIETGIPCRWALLAMVLAILPRPPAKTSAQSLQKLTNVSVRLNGWHLHKPRGSGPIDDLCPKSPSRWLVVILPFPHTAGVQPATAERGWGRKKSRKQREDAKATYLKGRQLDSEIAAVEYPIREGLFVPHAWRARQQRIC